MTEEQLHERESELSQAGYHLSRATSSTNDYSWFKTGLSGGDFHDPEDWGYMIEWRVWNWKKYASRDPSISYRPYTMELCVIVNLPDNRTSRTIWPDGMSITQAERFAREFYELAIRAVEDLQ